MTDGDGSPASASREPSLAGGNPGGVTDRDANLGLSALASAAPPAAPALSAAVEAELGTLAPVAPRRPLRQLAILVGLSVSYGAALLAMLTLRKDLDELPTSWLTAAGLAWLLGFIVPAYLALVPRAGTMTPRWPWAAAAAIVSSVAFVVLGRLAHPSGASSLDYGWARFPHGHTCLELGLATAIVPVVAGAIFLRGALPVGSRWIAACLGAAGGCLGGLVLHLHCPIADWQHVALIHGGVVGVSAALAAALAPRATDRMLDSGGATH